ncbi:hypothetical protein EIC74_RS12190 [Enterococcus hirae]
MFDLLGCLLVIVCMLAMRVFVSQIEARIEVSISKYITQLSLELQEQRQQQVETNSKYLTRLEEKLEKIKVAIESENENLRAQNHALEQENRRLESENKQIQVVIDQLTQKWIPKPSPGGGNKSKR